MNHTDAPAAKAAMLIRRPVADVFEAFVDPAITSRFWFSRGSGRLEAGKQVRWDWEPYKVSAEVLVTAIEPNARIVIEWSTYGSPTTVEWAFVSRADHHIALNLVWDRFPDGAALAEAPQRKGQTRLDDRITGFPVDGSPEPP